MKSVPLRGVLVSLIALVAIGGLVASGSETNDTGSANSSAKVTEGPCRDTGITIVVDFGELDHGSNIVRCVRNFQGTGWQIFQAAQLEVEGTSEYPEAFVCRINNLPGSDIEDCRGTPTPLVGSWVYFYASTKPNSFGVANSSWSKSPVGAATRNPKCGDFEGWLFVGRSSGADLVPSTVPTPIACK